MSSIPAPRTEPSTAPVVTDFGVLVEPASALAKRVAGGAKAIAADKSRQGGLKGLNTGRRDIFMLNPYLLRIKEGWNARNANDPDNLAHVDELARSIAEIGVKEPLTVFWEDDAPYVTNGHCRLLATFRAIEVYGAEVVGIPVMTEDRYSNEADRLLSQVVRNGSKPLKPLEEGHVFKGLLGLGWNERRIAASIGKSAKYVEGCLTLHAAPTEVRDLVATGVVAPTEALVQVRRLGASGAAKALAGAAATATKNGKRRVTKRDIEGAPAPTKKRLRDTLEAARVREGCGEVLVAFTPEAWAALREMAGLS